MLLKLLQHHQELFLAACRLSYNRKDYYSLLCTCKDIYNLIISLPFYIHASKLRYTLVKIKETKFIYNRYMSIRRQRDNLVVYSAWPYDRININAYCKHSEEHDNLYIINFMCKELQRISKDTIIKARRYVNAINCKINGPIPNWIQEYIGSNHIIHTDRAMDSYLFNIE
jgi:hypothetical protein